MKKPKKKTGDKTSIWVPAGTFAAIVAACAAVYQVWPRATPPQVEATPFEVMQFPGSTQTVVTVKILNVGGSSAFHVGIDGRYGNRFWTSEWVKARRLQGNPPGRFYKGPPDNDIPELPPDKPLEWIIVNAMDLESDVCMAGDKGFPIQIRVSWEDKRKKKFEEIRQHKLLCTRDTQAGRIGKGRSFTFMPDGLISKN